ncbi:MAG TPA: M20/M25/M40 family metallo-hydrolase [Longimicrobiales bacterium]|nr:M20/M25/M40 family metallo-hydrolase [Longimicrobiales bacterium]
MHPDRYRARLALLLAAGALPAAAAAQQHPLEHAPRPTSAAITEADLMTRLYIFADDSMMGRQFGREGNFKGTAYIARELRRLGIEPAGENGTYFQSLPLTLRRYTDRSTLAVNGRALRWIDDFIAVPGRAAPRPLTAAQVIYGGVAGDSMQQITAEQAAGRIVVLTPNPQGPTGGLQVGPRGAGTGASARFPNAAAVVTVDLHTISRSARVFINNPAAQRAAANAPAAEPAPATLRVTPEAAAVLFGRSVDGLALGAIGATVAARLDLEERPVPEYGRNVIGLVRGSDPALRGQYVVISAHNDHTGFTASPVDHDSLYAFNHAALLRSFEGTERIRQLPPEERAQIHVNVDSLRRLRPLRRDSIRNGADDDGSGSMAVLEIAEAVAAMPVKPKRSIIFIWHTGEESGLLGAGYFVENPTVTRDSIVANINLDMIGRGRADDLPGGGPGYLAVIGANRLSTDIGRAVEAVNSRQARPLRLDYRFDADVRATLGGAYNNIYGRSDHARYANVGIPIVFFFTGLHADYHQVTDEPQYIDYPNYTAVTRYVNELLLDIANAAHRPVVDGSRTD